MLFDYRYWLRRFLDWLLDDAFGVLRDDADRVESGVMRSLRTRARWLGATLELSELSL